MKDVTFGAYYPTTSFVHKMDARIKILLTIAYIVSIFLITSKGLFHFAGFIPCFAFLFLAVACAKVPVIKVIKSIKAIIFFIILSSILQLFFNKSGVPLWENGFITYTGLYASIFLALRILLVVMGASLLTLTTSPVEIADATESLLSPLKIIKFPVHEFALIMSIALRFIPTLLDETDRIIKAQKARGGDFESGNIIQRAKSMIPILVPLFVSAFRRANDLAMAMEARCYRGGVGRTRMKPLKYTKLDGKAYLCLLAYLIVLIAVTRLWNVFV